jgi:glycosyltransferase involved in cell wall biosynthesis
VKPRIGVLTNIPCPYGVELYDAIARRGRIDLRVWYCAARDTRRLWAQQQPLHWHRIGAGWHFNHWYLDPRPARELMRWKPDLAVLSVYPIPVIQAAMWGASWEGLPWVYWGEAVGAGGDSWLRRAGRSFALLPPRRWAAGFLAVGRKGVQNFRTAFGAARPLFNVPWFSNLTRFAPVDGARPQTYSNETTFLYVGSFIRRKGVDILARAFSDLVAAVPNVRLIVAGDGDPSEHFDRHLSRAAAARVERCGFIPWEGLPELYRRGDFLVMPSRYDGWGLVIPEAMASGLPVIGSTEAGATLDLVREDITGWRVTPGDPHLLATAMRRATMLPEQHVLEMRRQCVIRARRYDVAVGARVFERAVGLVLKETAMARQRRTP